METLDEARTKLREAVKKGGATCPCCKGHVQVYQRTVTSSMAAGLIQVYRYNGMIPFQPLDVQRQHGLPYHHFSDFQKLRYWGVIEAHAESGGYIITNVGQKFLLGFCSIDKYAVVYNSEVQRFKGPKINVRDCLKKRFDLHELLGRSKATDGDAGRALNPTGRLQLA